MWRKTSARSFIRYCSSPSLRDTQLSHHAWGGSSWSSLVLNTHTNQRTFATDKPDESLLDSFSPERMIEELQTLEKMSATIKRTKTRDSDSPGVSCTVAGNGRLDKVKIDDDLAGDLQTIERLTVEAYLGAREAVFYSSQAVVAEKLRSAAEK